jgi:hypothetical protein
MHPYNAEPSLTVTPATRLSKSALRPPDRASPCLFIAAESLIKFHATSGKCPYETHSIADIFPDIMAP